MSRNEEATEYESGTIWIGGRNVDDVLECYLPGNRSLGTHVLAGIS